MGRAQFIIDNPGLGLSSKLTDCGEVFFMAMVCRSLVGTVVRTLQYYLRNTVPAKENSLDFYDLDKKKLGEG